MPYQIHLLQLKVTKVRLISKVNLLPPLENVNSPTCWHMCIIFFPVLHKFYPTFSKFLSRCLFMQYLQHNSCFMHIVNVKFFSSAFWRISFSHEATIHYCRIVQKVFYTIIYDLTPLCVWNDSLPGIRNERTQICKHFRYPSCCYKGS